MQLILFYGKAITIESCFAIYDVRGSIWTLFVQITVLKYNVFLSDLSMLLKKFKKINFKLRIHPCTSKCLEEELGNK